MKKLLLVLAFVAVFFLGWGAHSWKGHRGMHGRGHGDHAMMCGHHGGGHGGYHHGGHHGGMGGCCGKMGDRDCCGKDSTSGMGREGCCAKMDGLDCCEKTNCEGHGKLDSTKISMGGHGRGECCKKGACDKRGDKKE